MSVDRSEGDSVTGEERTQPASVSGEVTTAPIVTCPPPAPIEEVLSAILHGAVWRGFDGPDGVNKDEALEYAGVLAKRVQAVLAFIADMGCLCDDGCYHASLPDHELHCPAQIEHLLKTDATAATPAGNDGGSDG